MADHPASTLFSARFESALKAYQHTTGVTLAEHPLTVQFQNPHSAESIVTVLKCEARVPSDLQESDTIVNSIENIVLMLFSLSSCVGPSDSDDENSELDGTGKLRENQLCSHGTKACQMETDSGVER